MTRPSGERLRNRKCKCGNMFEPWAPKQIHCLYCILKRKPQKPTDNEERRENSAFDEWFIYRWHNIRLAGARLRGVELEFDDGVREVEKGGDVNVSES